MQIYKLKVNLHLKFDDLIMISFPNAKINLGLNILEKRKDNFHNIESVFYPVEWMDALEIVPSENFDFQTSGLEIKDDKAENLCIRVYQSLKEKYKLPAIKLYLHKNIPIGAGLGGGSSDAAFTVKLLNNLFSLSLSSNEMQSLIKPFGSDCAFFIENKPVLAFSKGDEFKNISLSLEGKFIVLIYPDLHISTQEAYTGITPKIPKISIEEIIKSGTASWKEFLKNDFEESIISRYPQVLKLKEDLYRMGAFYASMSGSGSTVYGIFDNEVETKKMFPDNYKIWKGYLK